MLEQCKLKLDRQMEPVRAVTKTEDSAQGKGGKEIIPPISCVKEIHETGGEGQRGMATLKSTNLY
jgi:hypothetical protein